MMHDQGPHQGHVLSEVGFTLRLTPLSHRLSRRVAISFFSAFVRPGLDYHMATENEDLKKLTL